MTMWKLVNVHIEAAQHTCTWIGNHNNSKNILVTPGFCHRGGVNYTIVVLCAERSEAPFQPGVWVIFYIKHF